MIVLILILVIVAACVIGFFVVRSMKGKLELELPKTGFNSGEAITGSVSVTTKKSLELRRLFVSLIGYEVTEHRDADGDERTERDEIFRQEVNLEGSQQVPAGFAKSYQFEMVAPGRETVGSAGSGWGSGFSIDIGPLSLGGNNHRRRLEWKVEVRADLPGIDLAKSKTVRINVS